MRPFTSTKKPLESGHPINDKKPYQHKQTSILNPIVLSRHILDETESTKKLKSSASTRLLNNLTSKPLSKRVNSPVGSESARSLKRCPEMASLSPRVYYKFIPFWLDLLIFYKRIVSRLLRRR
jgi:hypothetical protein